MMCRAVLDSLIKVLLMDKKVIYRRPYYMGGGSEDHLKRYLTSLPELRWSRQGLLGGLAVNTRAVSG